MNVRLSLILALVIPFLAGGTAAGQTTAAKEGWGYGQVFFGGVGLFNFDENTTDPALHMGGGADFKLTPRLFAGLSAGFLANVGNNDAFEDRSILVSPGIKWRLGAVGEQGWFVGGGYTWANGETGPSRSLVYGGLGYSRWYGELIGWQLEVRDHFNGDLNFLEVRVAFTIR